ncbi:MAG: hypothetical protein FWH32_02945 [Clostridiales bacterium]|nr:hypothetical protein [Clostridiales bacterium]
MKKNRIKLKKDQLALLLIFLAVIALPGALLFQNTGRYMPGDNRMAASFPKIIKDGGGFATKTEFESFFDDNIGFRTFAPQIDTRVMYDLFGVILDTAQLQGKDGNLFAGDDRRFPTRRAPYYPLSEEELATNGRNIKAASDYFKSKDIPFLFITIPDKEQVHSGLYPDSFVKRPLESRLEQQVDWMLANTDVDAYDMTKALREKAVASDSMLWYETKDNAHWNYMGAWHGYLEIMERLRAYDPNLRVLDLDDFDISVHTEPYVSWDGNFVFSGLHNTVYDFDYVPGFACEQISNSNDPWMPQEQLDMAGFQKGGAYFHFYNKNQSGTLVVFGDSYIYQFLLPYLSESFEHVYLFHLPTNYTIMRPILDMIGADFVVLEMVERMYIWSKFYTMEDEFLAEAPVLTMPEVYPVPLADD